MQPRFITFEGGEGAGKSTQVRLLVDALQAAGIATVATREPGGAPAAETIRSLLVQGDPDRWDALTETLLHFAARREHVRRTVAPALARGACVVSDRFADSTMAYQGYGMGVGRTVVEQLYSLTVGDLRPDLTVILDVSVEQGLARARQRAGADPPPGLDRYERMGTDFHARLRAAFLDIASREPARCAVVPAGGAVAGVHAAVKRLVEQRLGISF